MNNIIIMPIIASQTTGFKKFFKKTGSLPCVGFHEIQWLGRQGAMHHSPIHLKNGPLECVQNVKKWPIENFKIIKKKVKMAHWQKSLLNPWKLWTNLHVVNSTEKDKYTYLEYRENKAWQNLKSYRIFNFVFATIFNPLNNLINSASTTYLVAIIYLIKFFVHSAVEILKSFVRHWSDRILDFVRQNKILSDQTFYKTYVLCYFQSSKGKKRSILSLKCYECLQKQRDDIFCIIVDLYGRLCFDSFHPSKGYFHIFCRTFGPALLDFLSDIHKKCPIVRQVRRISTALCSLPKHTQGHVQVSLPFLP